MPLVEPSSPLIPYLIDWTADRFKGTAAPDNCSTLAGRAGGRLIS